MSMRTDMKTTAITVYVPAGVALAAGKTEYGVASYELQPGDLYSLSREEMAWLIDSLREDGTIAGPERVGNHGGVHYPRLTSAELTWPAVLEALRRLRAMHEDGERLAAEDARRQDEINQVREACRQWAATFHPGHGVRRAALDGHNVVRECMEHIAKTIGIGYYTVLVVGQAAIGKQVSEVVSAAREEFEAAYQVIDDLSPRLEPPKGLAAISISKARVVRFRASEKSNSRVAVGFKLSATGAPDVYAVLAVPQPAVVSGANYGNPGR
jgi:hypothetical protein